MVLDLLKLHRRTAYAALSLLEQSGFGEAEKAKIIRDLYFPASWISSPDPQDISDDILGQPCRFHAVMSSLERNGKGGS